MPTIIFVTFHGTGHMHNFLEILQLQNYAFATGATDHFDAVHPPKGNSGRVVLLMWARCPNNVGPGSTILWEMILGRISSVASSHSLKYPQVRKRQRIADYITRIMKLCKDLDPQMSDKMKRTWFARGLSQYIDEVVFYAEGVDMVCLV